MSGQREAVELVYDLVTGREETAEGFVTERVGMFGDDHEEVRRMGSASYSKHSRPREHPLFLLPDPIPHP